MAIPITNVGHPVRRIIAEDPEWNLATVPLLTEICLNHIVHNFSKNPILHDLLPPHQDKLLKTLPVDVPLIITSGLIEDDLYWERCCKKRWQVCDVSKYGGLWKRMYFERHLEEIIEKFVPGTTDISVLTSALELSSKYVRGLNIKQLLPPVKEPRVKEEDDISDVESDAGENTPVEYFNFEIVVKHLRQLDELHISYGVRDCGMNFEWVLFEFTSQACLGLAKAIKACQTLRVFHLHQSKVDDEKCRVIIGHLLNHPSLEVLDLSHNKISDSGARAIGKLLNGHSRLRELNICNNAIRSQGAAALGHAIGKNDTLKSLDLRLNRLGDDGGQYILKGLVKNKTLEDLNLGSNELREPFSAVLSKVLVDNKSLRKINLSCNRIGQDGGRVIQEGLEENYTLTMLDLRLTDVGQESEYCINQALKRNKEKLRKTERVT